MLEALTIGWAEAQAKRRKRAYQLVLAANMLASLALGLGCLFAADFVSSLFGLPPPAPTGWIRAWGATLVLVTALYAPGLQDPLRSRFPNLIGIAGRLWMAFVWLFIGGTLIWLGVFELFFAVILARLFYRYCAAEIMRRP